MKTVSKLVISRNIKIDFEEDFLYGQDQMYNSYPVVFPTVMFFLEETDGLMEEAMAAVNDETFHPGRFYVGICGLPDRKVENSINFDDEGDDAWAIDLSEDEQKELWEALDAQCREKLGKGCEELLKESEAQMG